MMMMMGTNSVNCVTSVLRVLQDYLHIVCYAC